MADDQQDGASKPGGLANDWPAKAADTVDLVVDTIHDRVVRPALIALRAVVFGTLIVLLGLVVLVVLSVALVRILDVYAFGGRVWASDALLGTVLCAGGLLAWWKRTGSRSGTSDS